MHTPKILDNAVARNTLGLTLLLLVHALLDWQNFISRSGANRYTPYIFLVMMYLWIVFHNRMLFERMFLKGQRLRYLAIVAGIMVIFSFNIYVITTSVFGVTTPLAHIVSFWVYTVTGLGVFVIYRHLKMLDGVPQPQDSPAQPAPEKFIFSADGQHYALDITEIIFIESLENYIKVHTKRRSYIVRKSLKQAEDFLPRNIFIRISKSHIVNTRYVTKFDSEEVYLNDMRIRIGKVYKKYVAEQLSATPLNNN